MSGFSFWVWWYSLINSGLIGGEPGAIETESQEPLAEPVLNLDPDAGDVVIMMPSNVSFPDGAGIVRASRPLPVGRRPSLNTTRVIASIPLGVPTNVAEEYVARFGRLPIVGSRMLFVLRVADPVNRMASPEQWVESVVGGSPPAGDCYVSPESEFMFAFGDTSAFGGVDDPSLTEFDEWQISFEGGEFEPFVFGSIMNGEEFWFQINNLGGTPGNHTVDVRFECTTASVPDCLTTFDMEVFE